MRELSEHPATARAVLALYQAYRSTIESTRALASKVYDGDDFRGIDPAHLPSEEVSDVIQHNINFFPELEEIAGKGTIDRQDAYRSLVQHLRERHRIEVAIVPVGRDRAATRRYDPERRVLSLSEVLPPWSRQFQLAHQLGLIEAADVIDAIVVRSKEFLTTPESAKLCRIALAIGTTCRLCERLDCEQRAFPPLQHGFTIDENVRGASFYAPAVQPALPIRKRKR
jgi:predicted transcriptional regulator